MEEELIDIIDRNGEPTGRQESRFLVHTTGLRHRTVHIYFFRKNLDKTEFLVHLRSKTKDLVPNTWDTRFGGHVKAGETVREAVGSEVQDEIGITIDSTKLFQGKEQWYEKFPNNELVSVYYYHFDGDEKTLKFNDGEVEEVRWMTPEAIFEEINMNSDKWASSHSDFETILGDFIHVLSK